MRWWHRWWRRNKMEKQLDKELRFHIDQHTADLIARGHTPEEARRQARLALDGPEQVKEGCRDARGTRWLEDTLQDARYAVRLLWQKPGFSAVALTTVGLDWGPAGDDQATVRAQLYYPFAQVPDQLLRRWSELMSIAVKTDVEPLSVVEPLKRAVRGVTNDQVIYEVRTMEDLAGAKKARHRDRSQDRRPPRTVGLARQAGQSPHSHP